MARKATKVPVAPHAQQQTGLNDAHQAHLLTSALTAEFLDSYPYPRYRSVAEKDPTLKAFAPDDRKPGLLITIRTAKGFAVQLRPDNPGDRPKYASEPRKPPPIDYGPHSDEQLSRGGELLLICEGMKQTDCLRSLGYTAIGLTGCCNGFAPKSHMTKLRPEIANVLKGFERVAIALDGDAAENPTVATALNALGDVLESLGADVYVVTVPCPPGQTTGIDDYCFENGADETRQLVDYAAPFERRPQRLFADFSPRTLATILRQEQIECRYCVRAGQAQFAGYDGEPLFRPLDDLQFDGLRARIAERYELITEKGETKPLEFSGARFEYCMNVLLNDRRVDSFLEYLESLPPWDQRPRIELMLTALFHAEPTPLTRHASRAPFLTVIERCYKPGAKIDSIVVLISAKQGLGKSSLYENALPEQHPDAIPWFVDQLSLKMTPKELAEALRGRVFAEQSEMTGSSVADIESMKAALSTRNDGSRRGAYEKRAVSQPRRCAIVGTGNRADLLPNDPSGNRRFLPVVLKTGANVEQYMSENRDALWSECLALYRQGERGSVPRELIEQQDELNERHRHKDPLLETRLDELAERIRQRPEQPDEFDADDPKIYGDELAQIAALIGLTQPDRDGRHDAADAVRIPRTQAARLTKALHASGWTYDETRVTLKDGRQARLWYPPEIGENT